MANPFPRTVCEFMFAFVIVFAALQECEHTYSNCLIDSLILFCRPCT